MGTASQLEAGEYTVTLSATGMPRDALGVSTRFVVSAGRSLELDESSVDADSLRRVAELTGGKYLTENEFSSLDELLKPLVRAALSNPRPSFGKATGGLSR